MKRFLFFLTVLVFVLSSCKKESDDLIYNIFVPDEIWTKEQEPVLIKPKNGNIIIIYFIIESFEGDGSSVKYGTSRHFVYDSKYSKWLPDDTKSLFDAGHLTIKCPRSDLKNDWVCHFRILIQADNCFEEELFFKVSDGKQRIVLFHK